MKCMRRRARYTWTDYKANAQITKELKITPIFDKLLEYKRNWIQHVNRMPRNRLPRVLKHHSPTGRRNYGRPLKRLLDAWDRNGSTSGPTPWKIYDYYYYYYSRWNVLRFREIGFVFVLCISKYRTAHYRYEALHTDRLYSPPPFPRRYSFLLELIRHQGHSDAGKIQWPPPSRRESNRLLVAIPRAADWYIHVPNCLCESHRLLSKLFLIPEEVWVRWEAIVLFPFCNVGWPRMLQLLVTADDTRVSCLMAPVFTKICHWCFCFNQSDRTDRWTRKYISIYEERNTKKNCLSI